MTANTFGIQQNYCSFKCYKFYHGAAVSTSSEECEWYERDYYITDSIIRFIQVSHIKCHAFLFSSTITNNDKAVNYMSLKFY